MRPRLDTVAVVLVTVLALAHACTTPLDCSLNGDCVRGACLCDAGWTGASCGALAIVPGPINGGYHNATEASCEFHCSVFGERVWHAD